MIKTYFKTRLFLKTHLASMKKKRDCCRDTLYEEQKWVKEKIWKETAHCYALHDKSHLVILYTIIIDKHMMIIILLLFIAQGYEETVVGGAWFQKSRAVAASAGWLDERRRCVSVHQDSTAQGCSR